MGHIPEQYRIVLAYLAQEHNLLIYHTTSPHVILTRNYASNHRMEAQANHTFAELFASLTTMVLENIN